MERLKSRHISYIILGLKAVIITWLAYQVLFSTEGLMLSFDKEFLSFCLAGFLAQMVDGMLGMAYGVSCSTFLLHLGLPPALASASVHTAEVFTTGVSGLSHLYLKNVDRKLFVRLVIPGVIGAMLGAYLLSKVLDGNVIKPYIAFYLLILGLMILLKSIRKPLFKEHIKYVSPLGFIGGLLDAIGGGGWGPVVTSNLLHQGKNPQLTIGTVNTAEFFVAFFSTGVFLFFMGFAGLKIVLGLILGGILAAPVGAILVRFIRPQTLMFIVGLGIIIISLFTIYVAVR